MTRALSFGTVAARYERFRPGYPARVVDVVLGHARRPVRTALEIGAGTGKATRAFAAHGIAGTATVPDASMLRVLRAHVPADVVTVRSAFEDLPRTRTYDLVFAAASLHWTDPVDRWARVAALLEPDGVFASFGGQSHLTDPALAAAAHAARAPFLADDDIPSPDGTPPGSAMQWPGTDLERSPRFTDVRQEVVERRLTLTAADYVGLLSTVSAYLQLPVEHREQALDAIRRALPEQVEVSADVTVHVARRTGHG
ncbi:MAG: class I SAM-dependent methyltransferase [Actinobacteria bacterium]|nr:class I SAM-dependent methyltransferase [Actinomycetota bacterium]